VEKVQFKIPHQINLPEKATHSFLVHQYKFTEEEKNQIREAFKKMNPQKVEQFIIYLEFYCNCMKEILENVQGKDLRDKKKEILKSCNETLRYLNKIVYGQLILAPVRKVPTDEINERQDTPWVTFKFIRDEETIKFNSECRKRALNAVALLRAFIEIIEENLKKETPTKRGQKSADYIRPDFIRNIAMGFYKYIGKFPTTYKSGPFMEAVKIGYNAIGFPSADPSRIAKAVLNALKKGKTGNKNFDNNRFR